VSQNKLSGKQTQNSVMMVCLHDRNDDK